MYKLWRSIGLSQHIFERLSSLHQEVAIIQARAVPGKHASSSFMLSLKEVEIKAEAIPVHMHHDHTAKKKLKDKGEMPT